MCTVQKYRIQKKLETDHAVYQIALYDTAPAYVSIGKGIVISSRKSLKSEYCYLRRLAVRS